MNKFREGDRVVGVVFQDDIDMSWMEGTVVVIPRYFRTGKQPVYGIRFDIMNVNLHDLNGRVETGHGWFVEEDKLKLLAQGLENE